MAVDKVYNPVGDFGQIGTCGVRSNPSLRQQLAHMEHFQL